MNGITAIFTFQILLWYYGDYSERDWFHLSHPGFFWALDKQANTYFQGWPHLFWLLRRLCTSVDEGIREMNQINCLIRISMNQNWWEGHTFTCELRTKYILLGPNADTQIYIPAVCRSLIVNPALFGIAEFFHHYAALEYWPCFSCKPYASPQVAFWLGEPWPSSCAFKKYEDESQTCNSASFEVSFYGHNKLTTKYKFSLIDRWDEQKQTYFFF